MDIEKVKELDGGYLCITISLFDKISYTKGKEINISPRYINMGKIILRDCNVENNLYVLECVIPNSDPYIRYNFIQYQDLSFIFRRI